MNNSGGFISLPSENVDDTLSSRKLILEEGKEDVGMEEVLIHDDTEINRPNKRAKTRKTNLLETSVNSLISEDRIGDEEDDAIMHNSKDASNKNCSPGGSFES